MPCLLGLYWWFALGNSRRLWRIISSYSRTRHCYTFYVFSVVCARHRWRKGRKKIRWMILANIRSTVSDVPQETPACNRKSKRFRLERILCRTQRRLSRRTVLGWNVTNISPRERNRCFFLNLNLTRSPLPEGERESLFLYNKNTTRLKSLVTPSCVYTKQGLF
jgi:hypothetical protein